MASKMPTRNLGKEGPMISALGYGTMGLSGHYGGINDDETRFKVLDRAYELGMRFWDSSDMYGDSEVLIGKWFIRTGKRNEIFLSTKFGYTATPDGQFLLRSDPEYVKESCDRSLKRLGIDCIDLFYMHVADKKTPIEDTVEAMVELKKAGKIKYIGLCGVNHKGLRRAEAIHHIDSVQIEYSPFALDPEDPEEGALETCRELGIGVVCLSPLGRGFLTGRYKSLADFGPEDVRPRFPRFSPENFPKNLKLVHYFQSAAEKKGCTAAQLCLAFMLAQGDDIIPIPGTKSVKLLEENAGAVDVVLSPAEIKEIREEIAKIPLFGPHRPDWAAGIHGIETPKRV